MTKKGEDCCAAHNTRHTAGITSDLAGVGVNTYHNSCCSASCVYGTRAYAQSLPPGASFTLDLSRLGPNETAYGRRRRNGPFDVLDR
jgi:hypothetical protein